MAKQGCVTSQGDMVLVLVLMQKPNNNLLFFTNINDQQRCCYS